MAETKKLDAALLAAQQTLRAIDKDGRGNRGEYVSIDAAVANCRDALARHGLTLFQVSMDLETIAGDKALDRETGEEVAESRLILRRRCVLAHESGETREIMQAWPVRIEKRSPLDHSVAAADSFGLTYLLRGLLLFARGEDLDTSDRHNTLDRGRDDRDTTRRVSLSPVTRAAAELDASVDDSAAAAWLDHWRWEAPSADDLASYDDGEEVPRPLALDLNEIAKAELGDDWPAATWREIGARRGEPVTGRMARLFAAAIVAAA